MEADVDKDTGSSSRLIYDFTLMYITQSSDGYIGGLLAVNSVTFEKPSDGLAILCCVVSERGNAEKKGGRSPQRMY
jgi:hypothetical protein